MEEPPFHRRRTGKDEPMFRRLGLTWLTLAALGCASTPYQQPIDVSPVVPGRGERVVVDQAMILFDSSGSISRTKQFPGEKALLESFVASMPDGSYEAGALAFGGFERQTLPLAKFDRNALASHAKDVRYLSEGTPIHTILGEAQESLAGKQKRSAVVLLSDGLYKDVVGRDVESELSFDSARKLAESYDGKLCLHTVQVGNEAAGTEFLRKLASTTDCGSSRSAASLSDASSLQAFQREIFMGAAAAPVAAVPSDSDGDGVIDPRDQCPNTPQGAKVDARGCWVLEWVYFETNSAKILPASESRIAAEVLPVLEKNPKLRIRVDGHTDSRGSTAYNQKLSEQRANAVRDFLIAKGVAATRVEAKGFGEAKPIAPNDTAANLQKNRTTEITAIR
jgi:OOP family OmpA-OmpF porin